MNVGTDWLVDWNLAKGDTLNFVERKLEGSGLGAGKLIDDSPRA